MIAVARFITPFLAPLPLGLFFLLAALTALLLRLRQAAILSLLLSLGIFLFSGYGLVARSQLYELERRYPPFDTAKLSADERQQIQFVVVLGNNSHVSDPGLPQIGQLGTPSLYRLTEGIRIHRELPGSRLVVGGGTSQDDPRSNAAVAGQAARLLGVDSNRLVLEDRPRDTAEEAAYLKPLLGSRPFVLVTSAAHMARAVRLFQAAGLKPLAAPTDFILKDKQRRSSGDFLPSCGNLEISRQVIYEWLGNLWNWAQE
jgi:uncharacterized SAM-binding protein YcdF (DUF218 family)